MTGGSASSRIEFIGNTALNGGGIYQSNGDSSDLDVLADVPVSFDQRRRAYTSRRVRHFSVTLATGLDASERAEHDPFTLLGW